MQELSQIGDLELFYESERSKLFRAETGDNGTILLKEDVTGDLSRLHNEAAIRQQSGIGGLSSVMLFNGRTVFVREYIDGQSLHQLINGDGLSISQFLDTAIEVANALQEFHQSGLLHKDINPKNIIVSSSGACSLIDYEFGSAISKQDVHFEPLPLLVGTVNYISPEQTGRMNRKVDHRSDYYSLGVTFYEMLTGRLPFLSNDVLELIHAQLALAPKPPSTVSSKIPKVLDAIILKLLAKNAEERYQSISGLLVDLLKCQKSLETEKEIPFFEPGQSDIAAKLSISQELYGRKKEVLQLEEGLAVAAEGSKVLFTIGGFSGVGKSTLCQELYKSVTETNGIFLAGGFDVLDRQTPYLAWGKAFRQFADWLIAEERETQLYWSTRLHKDLKGLGKIIIEMAPNFKYILPEQPELVALTGYENQQRMQFAINSFLQSLAASEHPLLLFLDDYQWADDASMELLKGIFSNYSLKNLMVLIAYRDNEVDSIHPFQTALNKIEENAKEEGTRIQSLILSPLKESDVAELVADTLHVESIEVAALTNMIFNKTKGNAFAINKLLDSLYTQELLQFDYEQNKWVWDLEQINAQNLSENIVELLLTRIRQLDNDALQQIKVASVFGLQFSLDQLNLITESSHGRIHTMLWPLIQEGSIIPLGNDYHFLPDFYEGTKRDVSFRFAHPRIQQAVYELLTQDEQSRFHFDVGIIYLEKLEEKEVKERAIEIAHHFDIGYQYVTDSEERKHVGEVLLLAGDKAAASAAFEGALTFTEKAFKILKKSNTQKQNYDITIKLLEYTYLVQNNEKKIKFEKEAFVNAADTAERAAVYEVIIRCLGFANAQAEAVQVARKAMREMGIKMPERAKKWQIIFNAILLQIKLPPKKFNNLAELKTIDNKDYREIIKMMQAAGPSYFFVNIETYPLLIFKMIDLSMKFGNAPESVIAFASYGLILSGAMGKLEEGYNVVKESFNLLDKPGAGKYASTIYMIHAGFASHIKENIADSLEITQKGYFKGLEAGNMEYASWNLLFGTTIRLHIGSDFGLLNQEALEAARFQRQYNYKNQEAVTAIIQRAASVHAQTLDNWEESLSELNQKDETDFIEAKKAHNDIFLISYFGYKGVTNVWFGKYHMAFDQFEEFATHAVNQVSSFFIALYQFHRAFNATQLMVYSGDFTYKGYSLKKIVKDRIKEFKKLAKLNPLSYDPIVWLLEAQLNYALTKKIDHKKFEDALALFQELNHPRYILLCSQVYSERLKKHQDDRYEAYLNIAVNQARAMNAPSKERLLLGDTTLPAKSKANLNSGVSLQESSLSISGGGFSIDMQTLIKTIQALVSEIKLEDLLAKLLTYAMENTGAQEGQFIINRKGQWVVEVSTRSEGGLSTTFPQEKLSHSSLVSLSIVNYAMNTNEPLVIADAQNELPFSNDSYVKSAGIRSVMCIPFINQSKISGIIYLTHTEVADAFRKEHIDLMRLMAGQIATNIENALLYENLENLVEERTKQLEIEKAKSDDLLLNILPKEVAEELKNNGKASASNYDSVSVMFIDIKDFTKIAEGMSADQLVKDLDVFFSRFDKIITDHNLEKIKTIGDAYMAAGGIPVANETHHHDIINAAIDICAFADVENKKRLAAGVPLMQIRIGIHTGPVVAGVVGNKKFAYDIWGDAVNIAARVEQTSEVGRINISAATHKLIENSYNCTFRGEIPVKNKGKLKMYFVDSVKN